MIRHPENDERGTHHLGLSNWLKSSYIINGYYKFLESQYKLVSFYHISRWHDITYISVMKKMKHWRITKCLIKIRHWMTEHVCIYIYVYIYIHIQSFNAYLYLPYRVCDYTPIMAISHPITYNNANMDSWSYQLGFCNLGYSQFT